jgi:hypothetical protein
MADLNALIAQGAQFNLPNPVDQYSKVMQLQAAQQQMQMNRQQMQQIQEDRAGFAKLREKLADQNLTPEQYESALTQAPDPNLQKMGIELRMRRTRLAELDKEMNVGVKPAAEAPMAAPAEVPMAAPVAPKREMFVTKDSSGRSRYLVDGAEVSPQEYQSAQSGVVVGAAPAASLNAFPLPAFEPTNALAAQVAPAEPVANAMLAQPAAPVANAMAAKQAQIAEINRKLDVLNSPRYSDLTGVKGQIDTLERQLKQLTESPFAKESRSNFTSASLTKFGQSGNPDDLVPVGKEGTKSELARLISERAALLASGAAPTDNRVVAYDNAITKASAPSAGQPSDVTRLIAERNAAVIANRPADEIAALNAAIKKATTSAPPISVENKINTYMPASEEAQRDFIRSTRATYDTLKNAPGTLKNIEEAIKLIPNAKGFMGPGGESLLDAASFLNNRLGTNINTKGVTDATELRSRLFQGIIENLRKLDANPTENQQNAMRVALGNIGTDPNALPAVLNSFADTVRSKVDMHNAEVEGAVSRGVKFPYDPTIKLPTFTPPKATARPAGVPAEWTLQVDGAGKKAYVSPDGKSFKEVP